MKLSEAVLLSAPAFKEVYKLYNFKDDDSLKDYCDLVIHEPVEWMRGFPAAWKSVSTFSKPRAAFHKLMKEPSVIEALGVEYCENVHNVVWKAFKEHMSEILEKRSGSTIQSPASPLSAPSKVDAASVALSVESLEELPPVPPVPTVKVAQWPKNSIFYSNLANVHPAKDGLDYKQKYDVLCRVLETLLHTGEDNDSETARLRSAFMLLLTEFSAA
jgi:hypothetical protein